MKYFSYVVLFYFISSCSFSENDSEYFEGVIEYNIDYIPYSDSFTSADLEDVAGDKSILTFKKGNYKKEIYAKNGKLLSTIIFDKAQNKSFIKFVDQEIIYWVDITKHDTKLQFNQIKDSVCLGYSLIGVKTVGTTPVADSTLDIWGYYYYAKDLKINPDWYSNYFEANVNEIMKIGKGISLIEIMGLPHWQKSIHATSIQKRKVSDDELKVKFDKNLKLEEL